MAIGGVQHDELLNFKIYHYVTPLTKLKLPPPWQACNKSHDKKQDGKCHSVSPPRKRERKNKTKQTKELKEATVWHISLHAQELNSSFNHIHRPNTFIYLSLNNSIYVPYSAESHLINQKVGLLLALIFSSLRVTHPDTDQFWTCVSVSIWLYSIPQTKTPGFKFTVLYPAYLQVWKMPLISDILSRTCQTELCLYVAKQLHTSKSDSTFKQQGSQLIKEFVVNWSFELINWK